MAIKLNNLSPTPFSRPDKHRKGRGHAAGKGKQAGKGQSGQKKRGKVRLGFEGGQNPWYRRVPKVGFNNVNSIKYETFSLSDLDLKYQDNDIVSLESLYINRILRRKNLPAKLLANGELTKKLTIKVNAASEKAIEKVESLGGSVEIQ
ncbi:50S ribosomal protein L15 [Mesomycoplasma conjunctivae]|uniref:Large ribosomal subunit protein uL15 n=1 Tax=Mesomycoplasma conjunctivae (strain ATCC 25834 / NCTC 10147 / HRC/581) TaxID=572263 RepID=C5J5U9_MESCH|nr:50S ribosomal protein L15 [Mesomycoplasma conjunctivae]CAT04838.1 50S ribosomal protein L15 [Mesomycoplasma conjunctivae]VEU65893.1 50S ribosomal protein L15 [Mesomycoplasma conjunctivae]